MLEARFYRVWPGNAHRRAIANAHRAGRMAACRGDVRRFQHGRRPAAVSWTATNCRPTSLRDHIHKKASPADLRRRPAHARPAIPRPRIQGRRDRRTADLRPRAHAARSRRICTTATTLERRTGRIRSRIATNSQRITSRPSMTTPAKRLQALRDARREFVERKSRCRKCP